ncbi:MAG TPA: glycine cleavage system protein GcvH [Chloroflexota bacterium]|nr:glycine cleavage system protein GcvH [Chloroflexota bacterium]
MNPENLKYTKEHEWVRLDGDVAVVGITSYAQEQLGDVVYVDLPAKGATLKQLETFGAVDSVKTASDLYSPLSGEVIDINEMLKASPELVNSEPYGAGWMLKVKPSDLKELDSLLDAASYEQFLATLDH